MARLPRLTVPGLLHLIVHPAQMGVDVLSDGADRQVFLDALALAAPQAGVAVHAYGLLSTEVRLLVTPDHAGSLGHMMQAVGRRHVPYFNQRRGRSGSPWLGRFRSTIVEASAHFVDCLQFVEESDGPSDATDVLRSSAAHHMGQQTSALITEHPMFWSMGNTPFDREDAYRVRRDTGLPSARRQQILAAAMKGWALGTAEFVAGLQAQQPRRLTPLARGRPRLQSVPNK
jgi:putative transposase